MNSDFLIAPSHTSPVCFFHTAPHCFLCLLFPFTLSFYTSLCPFLVWLAFTQLLFSSTFFFFSKVLHWSSVRPRGPVSYYPGHRPHHHGYGAGPGARALAQHYRHRHPKRSEATLCTPLNSETLLELVHLVCFFHRELKLLNETSILPPAPTDEYEGLRGLKQCKLYIVCYLKSTVSTVWCTSLSGLALETIKPWGECCLAPQMVCYSMPENQLIYIVWVIWCCCNGSVLIRIQLERRN